MARTRKAERVAKAKQGELAYRRRVLDALGLVCEMDSARPLAERIAEAAQATGLKEADLRTAWLKL